MKKELIKLEKNLQEKGMQREARLISSLIKKYAQEVDSKKVNEKLHLLFNTYKNMFEQTLGIMSHLGEEMSYTMWETSLEAIITAVNTVDEVRDEYYKDFNDEEINLLKLKLSEVAKQIGEHRNDYLKLRENNNMNISLHLFIRAIYELDEAIRSITANKA